MGRQSIFITGGTGYIGSRLIPLLAQRDHRVYALVGKGSERKLPSDCTTVEGNALGVFLYHMSGQKQDTGVSTPRTHRRSLLTEWRSEATTRTRTSMAWLLLTNSRRATS